MKLAFPVSLKQAGYVSALLTALAGGSRAAECDSYGVRATTSPVPPQTATSLRRHVSLSSKSILTAETVVIGDSLVELWPREQLLEAFGPGSVLNFGVGGDRTQITLWRLAHATFTGPSPARVVIFLGTNNLSAGDAPCAIAAGMAAVIDSIRKQWPDTSVSILSVPPRGADLRFRENERIATNAELKKLASLQPRTVFFDDWEDFACGRSLPCDNYSSDMLHLSQKGYSVLSKQVGHLLK